MREIKFRAFENVEARNRMFQWDEIKNGFSQYLNRSDTIIMQFTGLKDKNGKEIYEGDICKVERYINKESIDIHFGIIEWNELNMSFYFKSIKNELSRSFGGKETIEVIGNIHDNPELLKDQDGVQL